MHFFGRYMIKTGPSQKRSKTYPLSPETKRQTILSCVHSGYCIKILSNLIKKLKYTQADLHVIMTETTQECVLECIGLANTVSSQMLLDCTTAKVWLGSSSLSDKTAFFLLEWSHCNEWEYNMFVFWNMGHYNEGPQFLKTFRSGVLDVLLCKWSLFL